jgi:hypothetical protein
MSVDKQRNKSVWFIKVEGDVKPEDINHLENAKKDVEMYFE